MIPILFLAAFLATEWIAMAVVARLGDELFFPHVFRYFLMAIVGLGFLLFRTRKNRSRASKPLQFSLKTIQASFTLAFLAYVLYPLLMFQALRIVPSGQAAMVMASVPVLALFGLGRAQVAWPFAVVSVAAGAAFFSGVYGQAMLRGDPGPAAFFLSGAVLVYLAALWISKKLFWLNDALELVFWSPLIASGAHFCLALIAGESWRDVRSWPFAYWICLAYLGIGTGGLGAALYRPVGFRRNHAEIGIFSAALPIFAVGVGVALWNETPLNAITVASVLALAIVLYAASRYFPAKIWMTHFLQNDVRQGDRHPCHLVGIVRPEKGASARIQVTDISIGGLGFQCDTKLEVSSDVVVELPLSADWSQVTLDCLVIHMHPSSDPKLPWAGGLRWRDMPDVTLHNIVEFLAKIAVIGETTKASRSRY